MVESKLIGYVRKDRNGENLKVSIDAQAFAEAEKFSSRDGREFVQLVMNSKKVTEIIDGDRLETDGCACFEAGPMLQEPARVRPGVHGELCR